MPELPEVEITRRWLARHGAGKVVQKVHLREPTTVRSTLATTPKAAVPDGGQAWAAWLEGRELRTPLRIGKRMAWPVDGGGFLAHLGMTGRWTLDDGPHARLGLELDDRTLWFHDVRRFGGVVPIWDIELEAALHAGLGPDALAPPENLGEHFRTRTKIKVALLDQRRIAGVGNIHACEALFRAGIHPDTPANAIDESQWHTLRAAILEQLEGTLRDAPDEMVYVTDGGPNPFQIYGKAGDPCPRCGAEIQRTTHGGRGTWWCDRCQPLST